MLSRLKTYVRSVRSKPLAAAAAQGGSGTAPEPPNSPNVRWGQFELRERLGRGSYGEVWRAWQPTLQREVALKLLKTGEYEYLEEARCLARVSHRNVVTVYDAGSSDGVYGLWMELLDGVTLARRLELQGPLSPGEVARIGIDVCGALQAIHSANLLHRDISAQNVMVTATGRTVLMDMGLGQELVGAPAEIAGTYPYIAPDLFSGLPATVQSDLYSLGVLLFHLLTCEFPVTGSNFEDFKAAHREGRRASLSKGPRKLRKVIERASHPDRARRFASAAEMAAALEDAMRVRSKVLYVALTLILGIASWVWWQMATAVPQLEFTKLTADNDLAGQPALSWDGQWIAYPSDRAEEGNRDIWVQRLDGRDARRLTTHETEEAEPAFSPDGKTLAFYSYRDGGGIYTIAVSGGAETLLVPKAHDPKYSPDGSTIAYWTGDPIDKTAPSGHLFTIPARGGTPRPLGADFIDARQPQWSPDGRVILFTGCHDREAPLEDCFDLWGLDVSTGAITETHALQVIRANGVNPYEATGVWDGKRLVFGGRVGQDENLWQLELPSAGLHPARTPARLSSGLGRVAAPTVSQQGESAFLRVNASAQIWRTVASRIVRVTDDADLDGYPTVSRDGRWLAFDRWNGGRRDLFVRDLASGTETALETSSARKYYPLISPGGTVVAYGRREGGKQGVYSQPRGGGTPTLLCTNCSQPLVWLDEGRRLLVKSGRPSEIYLVEAGQPASQPILRDDRLDVDDADWSPLTGGLVFTVNDRQGGKRIFAAPLSSAGEWVPITDAGEWSLRPRWSPDGRSVYFYSGRDGSHCLWRVPVGTDFRPLSPPESVQHFHSVRFTPRRLSLGAFNFVVAGDSVFFSAAQSTASVWVARPQR